MSTLDETPWPALDALVTEMIQTRSAIASLQARESQILSDAVDIALTRTEILRGQGRRQGADLPVREIAAELGTAMRLSDRAVQARMGDAAVLSVRFPATGTAWAEGRIDAAHVRAILDAGSVIDDDDMRARFESHAIEIAARETPARTRDHARAIAAHLDPDAAASRQRRAADARQVRVFDLEDGVSRLIADLPTTLAHAIADRLTQMARDVHAAELNDDTHTTQGTDAAATAEASPVAAGTEAAPGEVAGPATCTPEAEDAAVITPGTAILHIEAVDDAPPRVTPLRVTTRPSAEAARPGVRTLDQTRADVFADLLLAGAPAAHGDGDALGAITAHVQITVPALTLLGHDAGPALIAGAGPIDVETARRLCAGAPGWDRVLTDPHCGAVLAVDRYRPNAELRRFLAARDEHCRFPGCRRQARRAEIDHTVDAARGGETSELNLAHFCTRHHTLKHASSWTVRRTGPGVLEWTSPTSRRYEDRPPSTVRFVPSTPWQRGDASPAHPPF